LKIEGKEVKARNYYNRAVKALHPVKDIYRILELKLEKLQTIYLPKNLLTSIERTLTKQIEFLTRIEKKDAQYR
jgi:hypothetical protein